MFSLDVIDADIFLDMPSTARLLYYDLGMRADDEGFITPQKVVRMTGASQDDLRVLVSKGFVHVFDVGVIVILHWKNNNYIQADRFEESKYHDSLKELPKPLKDVYKLDTKRVQRVHRMDTQVRLGKVSIIKKNIIKKKIALTAEQYAELSRTFPLANLDEELERANDYLEAKGKAYKNYLAFFRNWLRSPYQVNKPPNYYEKAIDGAVFATKEDLDAALNAGLYAYRHTESGSIEFYPVINQE